MPAPLHPAIVTLRAAHADDETLFDRLLQFYAYEFSALEAPGTGWIDLDSAGRYNVHLRRVPCAAGAGSHLILWHDKVAGFATIDRLNPSGLGCDWNVAEFFVLAKYRRNGIGTAAIVAMLAGRPGCWEAAVMPDNARGLAFWRQALRPWGAAEVFGGGDRWTGRPVLRFTG